MPRSKPPPSAESIVATIAQVVSLEDARRIRMAARQREIALLTESRSALAAELERLEDRLRALEDPAPIHAPEPAAAPAPASPPPAPPAIKPRSQPAARVRQAVCESCGQRFPCAPQGPKPKLCVPCKVLKRPGPSAGLTPPAPESPGQ